MPWKSIYGTQGVEVRFSGRCDGAELTEAREALYGHRYEEGLQYIIADFSQVEYLDLSLADLLRYAEHDRQYLLRNPPHVLALVAPQAPVLRLLRMYEHYMDGSPLRSYIASTRAEALEWLHAEMLEPAVFVRKGFIRQPFPRIAGE